LTFWTKRSRNSIDREPLDKFIGEAITLNISNINIGDGIGGSDLENYSKVFKNNDILLLYTGANAKLKMILIEPTLRILNHLLRIGSLTMKSNV